MGEGEAGVPVITVRTDRVLSMVGASKEEVVEALPLVGIHLEEVSDEWIRLEYDPNRPDFSTDYGVARALKGRLGRVAGAPGHRLRSSGWKISVERRVKQVRPFVVGLLARGLALDDETIRQLIGMQEDLHQGIGRRRRKLAIGLHDAGAISPPIRYDAVANTFSFTPLGSKSAMTVRQVLKETETGKRYGDILKGALAFPMLTDGAGTVLSFPPIINGSATALTERTSDLFVDVTGTEPGVMDDALAIIAEALWDAGGEVLSVKVEEEGKERTTPSLRPRRMSISGEDVGGLLGLNLSAEETVEALRRCRLDASAGGGRVAVSIPRYRADILHAVDLVEEVGYGYGFERLEPAYDFRYSKGKASERSRRLDALRRVAVGLGLQEVMNYSLTSVEVLRDRVLRSDTGQLKVDSPKSRLYEYLRDMLSPDVLRVLSENVHEPYPQKVFEISTAFHRDAKTEAGVKETPVLAAAVSADRATYTEIRSILDTLLLRSFGGRPGYSEGSMPFLIEGRTAFCELDRRPIGFLGEVKPEVLAGFGLRMPVALLEIDISSFLP